LCCAGVVETEQYDSRSALTTAGIPTRSQFRQIVDSLIFLITKALNNRLFAANFIAFSNLPVQLHMRFWGVCEACAIGAMPVPSVVPPRGERDACSRPALPSGGFFSPGNAAC
jgi:hypothetical protein